jgi:hypothetical protein
MMLIINRLNNRTLHDSFTFFGWQNVKESFLCGLPKALRKFKFTTLGWYSLEDKDLELFRECNKDENVMYVAAMDRTRGKMKGTLFKLKEKWEIECRKRKIPDSIDRKCNVCACLFWRFHAQTWVFFTPNAAFQFSVMFGQNLKAIL